MTAKEKAEQLVKKFKFDTRASKIIHGIILGDMSVIFQHHKAKQCAIISVNEILKAKELNYLFTQEQINCLEGTSDDRWIYENYMKYWKKVKQEIKKL